MYHSAGPSVRTVVFSELPHDVEAGLMCLCVFLLQVVYEGGQFLGLIGHTSPDAFTFDVDNMWKEGWLDGQDRALGCVAS